MNVHTLPLRAHDAQASLPSLPQGFPPELIAAIEDEVRTVLNREGPSAFTMPREAALTHEAGHAIVATHEGIAVRRVTIASRSTPFGKAWGGWCTWDEGWTTGPDTSADDDLRYARIVIAGLAGEAITGTDKPGSSIDELMLSQLLGCNAATKLGDPEQSNAEHEAYRERLWHEQVWGVTIAILHANREPFMALVEQLHRKEKIHSSKLRKILKGVAS